MTPKTPGEYYEAWLQDPAAFRTAYLGKTIRFEADTFTFSFSQDDNFRVMLEHFDEEGQVAALECFLSKPEFMKIYAAPAAAKIVVEGMLETVSQTAAEKIEEYRREGLDAEAEDNLMEALIFDAKVIKVEPLPEESPEEGRLLRPGDDLKVLRAYSEAMPYEAYGDCGHLYSPEVSAAFWNIKGESELRDFLHLFYPERNFEIRMSEEDSDTNFKNLNTEICCRKCAAAWDGAAVVVGSDMTGGSLFSAFRLMAREA